MFTRLNDKLELPGKDLLKTGQLTWIRSRDRTCSRHEPSGFYVNLACATSTTVARTEFLESRYRECVSTGCLVSRLR